MKKINAVEMVRKVRDRQFMDIKDASHSEIIKYFHDKASWISEKKRSRQYKTRKEHA